MCITLQLCTWSLGDQIYVFVIMWQVLYPCKACVGIRGELVEASPLLSPCGFWGSNSGPQA